MNIFFRSTALFASIACTAWAGDTKPEARGSAVVAEVDGVKLTRGDFERKYPAKMFQARNSYYEVEKKAVDEYIEEYLVDRQAKKEGLTVVQLFKKYVEDKLPPDPSDDALRVYYEGLDSKEPFEAMKGKILQHLRERRISRIKTEYLASLKKEAKIEVRLMTPRAEVSLANTPVRGSVNAPVMLIEYADYECPYCQQMQPVLDKLESEYKGKIAFAYKDVPLPNHPNAQRAAEASHCAAAQGKYWEYHDILVSKKQLDPAGLKLAAVELKLDSAAFDKCVQSGETTALIRTHLNEAQSLGLQGTPSFFINGRFLNGLLSYENLKEIVEEELKLSAEPQRAGLK